MATMDGGTVNQRQQQHWQWKVRCRGNGGNGWRNSNDNGWRDDDVTALTAMAMDAMTVRQQPWCQHDKDGQHNHDVMAMMATTVMVAVGPGAMAAVTDDDEMTTTVTTVMVAVAPTSRDSDGINGRHNNNEVTGIMATVVMVAIGNNDGWHDNDVTATLTTAVMVAIAQTSQDSSGGDGLHDSDGSHNKQRRLRGWSVRW